MSLQRRLNKAAANIRVRQKEGGEDGAAPHRRSCFFALMESGVAGGATARHRLISPRCKVMNTAFPWVLIYSNAAARSELLHFSICKRNLRNATVPLDLSLSHTHSRGMCLIAAFSVNSPLLHVAETTDNRVELNLNNTCFIFTYKPDK